MTWEERHMMDLTALKPQADTIVGGRAGRERAVPDDENPFFVAPGCPTGFLGRSHDSGKAESVTVPVEDTPAITNLIRRAADLLDIGSRVEYADPTNGARLDWYRQQEPVLDKDGNPVPKRDADGKVILDGGQPVPKMKTVKAGLVVHDSNEWYRRKTVKIRYLGQPRKQRREVPTSSGEEGTE